MTINKVATKSAKRLPSYVANISVRGGNTTVRKEIPTATSHPSGFARPPPAKLEASIVAKPPVHQIPIVARAGCRVEISPAEKNATIKYPLTNVRGHARLTRIGLSNW